MPTVNELLRDAYISHQVDLAQYSNSVVRRIITLLNRADKDLAAQLRAALDRFPPSTVFATERLDAILHAVRSVNAAAYAQVGQELTAELRKLTAYEGAKQLEMFSTAIPAQMGLTYTGLSADVVYAAAMARPFQGRLLNEWVATLELDRANRIRDTVRMGFIEGQTLEQIVRRVRGTKAGRFEDGVLQIDRRNAEAVVRTAVAHVAATARDSFYESNDDLIKAVVWSATLDTRTSSGCRIRDNKHYHPKTHKPIGHTIPWLSGPGRLHWRCRSSSYPVTKSWRELGVDMDEMDAGTRASMDGQVPAETTYGEWLRRQAAERMDEVVGATRGKLMRAGKLDFDDMYTDRGELLTLDDLYKRHAAAFKRAGVPQP